LFTKPIKRQQLLANGKRFLLVRIPPCNGATQPPQARPDRTHAVGVIIRRAGPLFDRFPGPVVDTIEKTYTLGHFIAQLNPATLHGPPIMAHALQLQQVCMRFNIRFDIFPPTNEYCINPMVIKIK
jgi:hypothetical protein